MVVGNNQPTNIGGYWWVGFLCLCGVVHCGLVGWIDFKQCSKFAVLVGQKQPPVFGFSDNFSDILHSLLSLFHLV